MISSLPLTSALSPVSDIASGPVRIPVDGAQGVDSPLQDARALFASVLDTSQSETGAHGGEIASLLDTKSGSDADLKSGIVVPPDGKSVPDEIDEQVSPFTVLARPVVQPHPFTKAIVTSDVVPDALTAKPGGEALNEVDKLGTARGTNDPEIAKKPGEPASVTGSDTELGTAPPDRDSVSIVKNEVPPTVMRADDARPVMSREARRDINSQRKEIAADPAPLATGEPRAVEAEPDVPRTVQSRVAATLDLGSAVRLAKSPKLEPLEENRVRPRQPILDNELATPASKTASQPAALLTTAPVALDSVTSPIAPTVSAPTQSTPLAQSNEIRSELRALPQVDQAIEQMTEAREAGRSSRPELLLRHAEFGAVSMRLDAAGGDLRATLASRDPGFVPAIQAALNERAVAASSESATHNNQRGQDQQSGGNSSAWLGGSGGGFEQRYGSSPGSSEGPLQPRMEQQGSATRELDETDRANASRNSPDRGGNGVFA